MAVQDLSNILKHGYLEKKRRGIAADRYQPWVKYFYQVMLTVLVTWSARWLVIEYTWRTTIIWHLSRIKETIKVFEYIHIMNGIHVSNFPFDLFSLIITHFFFVCVDHSFFGSEWQKRWCVLNNSIFYYFGSEKGLFEMPTYRNIYRLRY